MTEALKPRTARGLGRTRHWHASREINGMKSSPTYQSWQAMRARCRLENRNPIYKSQGIKVCDRWESFDLFLSDMGVRPEGTTLDRWPNKAGDYEPQNCRWATPREQARNTRKSKLNLDTATEVALMRLSGVTCKEIAEKFGISESLPREILRGKCWPDALEKAKAQLSETS